MYYAIMLLILLQFVIITLFMQLMRLNLKMQKLQLELFELVKKQEEYYFVQTNLVMRKLEDYIIFGKADE